MSGEIALTRTHAGLRSSVELLTWCVGFFFAFRLFFVLLAVRVFRQEATLGVGASLCVNYLLVLLVGFDSIGRSGRRLSSMLKIPCARFVLLFFVLSGSSLLWSSAVSLAAAAAFWCAMVADSLIVFILLRDHSSEAVVNPLMKGYLWGSTLIAIVAWLLPSQSDLRLGDEGLLGPNQIGFACAFALFFAQYLIRRKEGAWRLHVVLLLVTLLRSLSKTTIIAFAVAEAYILFRDRSISRRAKRSMILGLVVLLLLFSGLLTKYYGIYTNAGSQSETLTGRVGIWAFILNEALQQPWLGHGFHSVWKVIPPFGPDQFEARHAHNELLQQFYAYGLVGIMMLIAIYTSFFRQVRTIPNRSLRTFFIGMLLFVLVRGLADTEVFDLSLPMWSILLIGSIIEQSQLRREVLA